jgi:glyoxylase-like metal-dependent hydrolase (beta-lactamase superfamily II)
LTRICTPTNGTGSAALRDRTHCITVMGEQTHADVISMRVAEGERVNMEGLSLDALYAPGHTDDSYSFVMDDRVFTGDTLLIRGTGRTDFQNGDARAQYDSIFNKLLKLPDETLVYPAHDYKGESQWAHGAVTAERAHAGLDTTAHRGENRSGPILFCAGFKCSGISMCF